MLPSQVAGPVPHVYVLVWAHTCDAPLTLVVTGLWYLHCSLILNPGPGGGRGGGGGERREGEGEELPVVKEGGTSLAEVWPGQPLTQAEVQVQNQALDSRLRRNSSVQIQQTSHEWLPPRALFHFGNYAIGALLSEAKTKILFDKRLRC